MEDCPLPDLRDIELKLGRKVPESLARSLRGEEPAPQEGAADPSGVGGSCSSSSSCSSFAPSVSSSSSSSPASGSPRRSHPSALERLETKLHILRQEMVSVTRRWRPRDPGPGTREGSAGAGEKLGGGERKRLQLNWNLEDFARSRGALAAPSALLYFLIVLLPAHHSAAASRRFSRSEGPQLLRRSGLL